MKSVYNGLGQKIQQIEDLGGLSLVTEYTYYPDGDLHTVTDAEQHTTTYSYDALGRVTTVVDTLSQTTSYAYDSAGNLRSLTDANSQTSGFAYNGLGQVTGETRPMGESTSYTYNDSGKLETRTDANGQRTEYVYEAGTNLLTDISYFDSSDTQTGHVSFTYERGQLSGYDDGTISATYAYNAFGQKLSETVNYPGFSKTFSYGYDANGQKRYFSMPDGTTYSYTYNDNNELEDIRIPGVGNISYPSYTMGRPDSMSSPGDTRSYAYDALLRLDTLESSTLDYAYSYDDVGNILTKQTEHGNYTYGYDDVYRLISTDNPTLDDEAYTYDGVGNRETASDVTGTIIHNANNELTIYGDISYEYDANGNMVRKSIGTAAVNYIYNVENRLIRVEDELSGTVIAEYEYDPFGRRLWKDVGGTRTYFFYADEGLIAEYDASGTELKAYGYKPDSTWTTDPLFQKVGSMYYWYQNDHLGTPQKLIDMNGMVVWEAHYDAFGNAQIVENTIENNLRFPGQYYDAETGLHYNWNRYYDPMTGRYTQVDPIGFAGGLNLYGYVRNDPLSYIDPEGNDVGGDCFPIIQVLIKKVYERLMRRLMRPRCKLGEYLTTGGVTFFEEGFDALSAKWETGALVNSLKQAGKLSNDADAQKAFRHCYVNCRMTQTMGPVNAKQAADTHEWCGSVTKELPPLESICQSLADAQNNAVGRALGQSKPPYIIDHAIAFPNHISLSPAISCEAECLQALKSGKLTKPLQVKTCDPGTGDPWEQFRPAWWAF